MPGIVWPFAFELCKFVQAIIQVQASSVISRPLDFRRTFDASEDGRQSREKGRGEGRPRERSARESQPSAAPRARTRLPSPAF